MKTIHAFNRKLSQVTNDVDLDDLGLDVDSVRSQNIEVYVSADKKILVQHKVNGDTWYISATVVIDDTTLFVVDSIEWAPSLEEAVKWINDSLVDKLQAIAQLMDMLHR